jgi:hypothetical protein
MYFFLICIVKPAIKNISIRLLIAVIAIQIINLSIDAVEFQPIATTVTINDFNYFNSITEYISEIVMGNKDAFPEFQKESSSSKSQIIKHLSFKLYQQDPFVCSAEFVTKSAELVVPLTEDYTYQYFQEINPPPPKA